MTPAEAREPEIAPDEATSIGATGGATPQRWHAALAYALIGPPVRTLVEPGTPRVAELVTALGGVEAVRDRVRTAQQAGSWPYAIPDDLRRGLGPAQLAAAWRATVAAVDAESTNARPVVTDRALTADDRRLLADRPPHHGG